MLHNKVLVTGGSGFIGSHLVDRLIRLKMSIVNVDDRSSGKYRNDKIKEYPIDITDYENIERVFDCFKPDYVFHLAAAKKVTCEQEPFKNLEVNALGTLNLLKLSHQYDVKRFFYASTGSVYGYPVYSPQDESHPTRSKSPYGIAKLIAEGFCRFYYSQGLDITMLRYFHVYGPRQRCQDNNGGVVGIFCRRVTEELPLIIHGDGKQVRSFTHVSDIVDCNICALRSNTSGKIFNCASSIQISINELAEKIIRLNGSGIMLHQGIRNHDIENWNISNEKIRTIGKVKWLGFDTGLRQTFFWYKNRYG